MSDYLNHPVRQRSPTEDIGPLEEARSEIDVPEDAHYDRVDPTRLNWDCNRTRPSASAAAAALRWEERASSTPEGRLPGRFPEPRAFTKSLQAPADS